ncbi:hypothetical protein ACWGE0_40860 [Lentzea sp. NPDC054927]
MSLQVGDLGLLGLRFRVLHDVERAVTVITAEVVGLTFLWDCVGGANQKWHRG